MVRIPNTRQGLLDEAFLIQNLRYYQNDVKKRIICTFNAASNVTGIRTDVDKISTLVHKYNGLVFWDYAAAAPYVKMDMNPSKTAYKDAIFISPHKFVGGPGTPGKFSKWNFSMTLSSSTRNKWKRIRLRHTSTVWVRMVTENLDMKK
jgi:selenocysteine lyase/cysteine desulfurase